MVEIKKVAIALALINLAIFLFAGPVVIKDNPTDLRNKITTLEQQIPELEKIASWTMEAERCLEPPPSEEPNVILGKLRTIAGGEDFTVTNFSNQGGEPPKIVLTGKGTYQATVKLINELDGNQATKIERIIIDLQDQHQLDVSIESTVRKGPWCGEGIENKRPAPLSKEAIASTTLGKFDLFGLPPPPPPVKTVVNLPKIRYLGFYSDKGVTTAILEENGKSVLVDLGQTTPGGSKLVKVTEEAIDLQNNSGKKWHVRMEKNR